MRKLALNMRLKLLAAFERVARIGPAHLAIVMLLGNPEYDHRFRNASPDRTQTEQTRRSGVADSVPRYALEHDQEKWKPVFRKDHAQTINQSWMTIRR